MTDIFWRLPLLLPSKKGVEREPGMQFSPSIAQSIYYAGKASQQVLF